MMKRAPAWIQRVRYFSQSILDQDIAQLGVQHLSIDRDDLDVGAKAPGGPGLLVGPSGTSPASSHQLGRRVAADFCLAAAAEAFAKHCRRLAQRLAPEGCVGEAGRLPQSWHT